MKYLPLLFLTACYLGSTVPAGDEPTLDEQSYIDCVTDLLTASERTSSLLAHVGILAGPSQVTSRCAPGAASCALLLEGIIVYDGEDLPVLSHEILHFYEWYEFRRVEYNHDDPKLWAKSGGQDSIEWMCRHKE